MSQKPSIPTLIDIDLYDNVNGSLCVFEKFEDIDFQLRRVFTISAQSSCIRGNHAHKTCSQMLVCLSGNITVVCDNGEEKWSFILDKMNKALLIPPLIWASQTYPDENSILMVLCDRHYEEKDYIRNYSEFNEYRSAVVKGTSSES